MTSGPATPRSATSSGSRSTRQGRPRRSSPTSNPTRASHDDRQPPIIELAHGLGMTVVSEGVETAEQHRRADRARLRFLPGLLLRPADARQSLDALSGSRPPTATSPPSPGINLRHPPRRRVGAQLGGCSLRLRPWLHDPIVGPADLWGLRRVEQFGSRASLRLGVIHRRVGLPQQPVRVGTSLRQ